MRMLNDIYNVFDKLLAKYDAFKVETIGDAYVAVSGALHENPRHAAEVWFLYFKQILAKTNFRFVPSQLLFEIKLIILLFAI